uniref:RHS repeat-associated core domain-containing protein n=1 Tax=Rheinheimera sp. TaxID=1869214 RepID=UPI0040473E5F
MNGRAYDYNLGRFLSVDPIIQAPGNSQSLNPYSYIMNNPLAGTDPTGYCSKELGSNICSKEPSSVQVSATLAGNMMAKAAQAAVNKNGAPQSAPNVQVSPQTSVVDIGDQQSKANNSGGDQHSKMETSDGWSYKGKTNDVDTYSKIYNRQDILNSIDDSGTLNFVSEWTLPWDAATCLHNGCSVTESLWATAMMIPLARSARNLDGLSDVVNTATYTTKQAARRALDGPLGVAANRFFRDAAKNAQDIKINDLADGGKRFEFFSPAKNAGYGKHYVQEVDGTGAVIREFKNTLGPDGLIETKWLHGGP